MPNLPKFLSNLKFGSFLAYSPHGQSDLSKRSRDVTYDIKNARQGKIDYAVQRFKEELAPGKAAHGLKEFFGQDVIVVPCPKSSPLVKGALWPAREICNSLVRHGLAQATSALVERFSAVRQSRASAPGNRPKPLEHLRSMRLVTQLELAPTRITLVDDVITLGATLLAAASHIHEQFPECEIKGFALVRTKGLDPELGQILDPAVGDITFDGVDANRTP